MPELSEEQERCVQKIVTWYNDPDAPQCFIVDGYAGTGKTFMVKHAVQRLNLECVLYAAFTGKAALVLQRQGCDPCSTIHKLIYHPSMSDAKKQLEKKEEKLWAMLMEQNQDVEDIYDDRNDTPAIVELRKEIDRMRANASTPSFRLNFDSPVKEADLVIVDEHSMVSNDLGKDLASFNTKILALGDPGQLPPVYGSSYFGRSEPDFTLTHIHRQAEESPILTLATAARLGKPLLPKDYGQGVRVLERKDLTPAIALEANQILCGRNKTRHINNARMRKLKGFGGELPQPGEKLVCLRNNHDKGLLNGSLWIVQRANRYTKRTISLTITAEEGGAPITVKAHAPYFRMYGHTEDKDWWETLEREEKSVGFDIREAETFTYGDVLTVHKCVAGDTLVETADGIVRIKDLPSMGVIATVDGFLPYTEKHAYGEGDLYKIVTRDGYSVTVTPDHKLMAWNGTEYAPRVASGLSVGEFLRLRLGVDSFCQNAKLPDLPTGDSRSKIYPVPSQVTKELSEFLGLMVADGTLYKRGFRLVKRHRDVVERFAYLCRSIFNYDAVVTEHKKSPAWQCEVNSTLLVHWLTELGGLAPNQKDVPNCVLSTNLDTQARFLRGLFEDGSVSKRDGSVELITHAGPDLPNKVQLMLLKQGIVSRVTQYKSQPENHRRIHVQGRSVQRFKERVGFISATKYTTLSSAKLLTDMRKRVPVDKTKTKDNNAKHTGYTSREKCPPEMLDFHHDQIVSIEKLFGPSYCVTVPAGGRFLQNGFDGCNSQGSQWDNVLLLDEADSFGVDSKKHRYTGITRAIKGLTVVRM